MKAGADEWIEAEVGMSLEVGDSIKAGDDSGAEITFVDGSTIELQAGTEIEIDSLATTDTGSATILVKQTIGSIIFRVTKIVDPGSRYEVETPAGVVAIRGSAMQVYVIEDGTTLATNLEGDMWAVAQGVELQVSEGRQCIIRPDEPPELVAEVTFTDANLEAAVRKAIAIPTGSIYTSDLVGLTSLNASEKNITDLTGLEYATSLIVLRLWGNQISNISPLAGLTKLNLLILQSNQISDVTPLTDLTSLTYIDLTYNQISDISPLANLTGLTGLFININQISDISPLANLTSLIHINIARNEISDISPLANVTSLRDVFLVDNQISDISPLSNLTSLTYLQLGSNQISDVSPLASLTSLTLLSLYDNQISDISPLSNLTSLTQLDLADNQISDISPLVENPGLGEGDEVDLRYNALSAQSVNEYIPALEAKGVTVEY